MAIWPAGFAPSRARGYIAVRGCTVRFHVVHSAHIPNRVAMKPAIDAAVIDRLRQHRILFGHQSVGANMVAGIEDLLDGDPERRLKISESDQTEAFREPGMVHLRIGRNHEPESKLAAFAELLRHGIGRDADLALFKFCYVDVTANTDAEQLFDRYRDTMTELAAACPGTRIAHVTIPVTTMPGMLHRMAGTLLRRHNRAAHDNLARAEFNRKLRATYGGIDPIFDLATVEATAPSGRINRFSLRGRNFEALYPPYSSDGRHLSESGRQVVAAAFLKFLAQALEPVDSSRRSPGDRPTPIASTNRV